jgi:hypothetical protein
VNIKNYTSQVSAATTILRIEALLIDFGATAVRKDYANGKVVAFQFQLKPPAEGLSPIAVVLPAEVERVGKKFLADHNKRYRASSRVKPLTDAGKRNMLEQAERTAWRLVEEWLRIQLSLIEMDQAEAAQVFLPYMVVGNKGQTLFASIKETNFAGLLAPPKPRDCPACGLPVEHGHECQVCGAEARP